MVIRDNDKVYIMIMVGCKEIFIKNNLYGQSETDNVSCNIFIQYFYKSSSFFKIRCLQRKIYIYKF